MSTCSDERRFALHTVRSWPMLLTSAPYSQGAALMRFIGALVQKSYPGRLYEARFEVLTAALLKI